MIINGKTTSAEIFTDNIEESALTWLTDLCDHPAMEGVPVVQMPDVHCGNGCNVGTAYPVGQYLNPDHVGADIGCTISMHRLSAPVSPDLINEVPRIDSRFIIDFCRRIKLREGMFYKSLGTLGGGNHFIEYGEDEESGQGWLTIHCGSRNLGVKVANHWRNIAANPKRARFAGYLWGDSLRGKHSLTLVEMQKSRWRNHDSLERGNPKKKFIGPL